MAWKRKPAILAIGCSLVIFRERQAHHTVDPDRAPGPEVKAPETDDERNVFPAGFVSVRFAVTRLHVTETLSRRAVTSSHVSETSLRAM